MKINTILETVTFVIGVVLLVVGLTFLIQPNSVEAQSQSERVNIQRYEFPQDGVVCYRPSFYQTNAPLSCVKIR